LRDPLIIDCGCDHFTQPILQPLHFQKRIVLKTIRYFACQARGDDVSSVVDVIPSESQDMALQTIVSRPHHLICPSQIV